jgi:hypothetical protein
MSVTPKMLALLGEENERMPDPKVLIPQLVLAMEAAGMDPGDEGHQEIFIGMLKKLVSSKAALLKGMKMFNASKALKALKVAKAAV